MAEIAAQDQAGFATCRLTRYPPRSTPKVRRQSTSRPNWRGSHRDPYRFPCGSERCWALRRRPWIFSRIRIRDFLPDRCSLLCRRSRRREDFWRHSPCAKHVEGRIRNAGTRAAETFPPYTGCCLDRGFGWRHHCVFFRRRCSYVAQPAARYF